MIDKGKAIQLKFVSIVSKGQGQGIHGWDKFADIVQKASEIISDVESMSEELTNRISDLELPFPDKLTIPKHTVRILGKNVTFKKLNIPVPKGDRKFPRVSEFYTQFLEPGDRILDKMLELVTEIDDSQPVIMSFNKPISDLPENSDDFPNANYLYNQITRDSYGDAQHRSSINMIAAYTGAIRDLIDDFKGQVVITGAGGNVSLFTSMISILNGCLSAYKELLSNIDGDTGGAEVTASYERLGYIHLQVDSVNDKVETLTNKIDNFRDSHSSWEQLSIRTKIEENLAGHGDHPHPIAIFQLPQQFGGYLEIARNIVFEIIIKMVQAGQDIYNAENLYDQGNVKYNQGEYKQAYYYYSKAHGELTKVVIDEVGSVVQ
jgi:hypothetical protein